MKYFFVVSDWVGPGDEIPLHRGIIQAGDATEATEIVRAALPRFTSAGTLEVHVKDLEDWLAELEAAGADLLNGIERSAEDADDDE